MRKIITSLLILLFAFFVFSVTSVSAKVISDEKGSVNVGKTEIINDDLFIGAETAEVAGTVNGDVFVGAQTVKISGIINGNLHVGANTFDLRGTVKGNVYAGAQNVLVSSSTIGGSLLIGAATVNIDRDSSIGGSILAGAGGLTIDSQVKRSVYAGTGNLTIGSDAIIGKDLYYSSGQEQANISSSAKIAGSIYKSEVAKSPSNIEGAKKLVPTAINGAKVFSSFIAFIGALIVGLLIFRFSPALLDRFGNTIKKIDVVVDVKTGNPIGHARKVSSSYFQDKPIRRRFFQSTDQLNLTMTEKEAAQVATPSALVPLNSLQPEVVLVEPPNAPTGESLPQGTGYINLSLSPVTKRVGEFFYEKPSGNDSSQSAFMFQGDFLIKRASAYDLSFTTRFQGEWPRAVDAFKRNILVGSGYSSVGLAVDNNYLRLLGETGILGLISFLSIFMGAAIYIIKVFPKIESPFARSFVVGFSAGVVGLMLNALLIDVFDASKIAYVLWILMGVLMATLHIYADKNINLFQEFKKIVTSSLAVTLLLAALAITFYYPMVNNFFVGDDFTWLRWVADCPKLTGETCQSLSKTVFGYFTSADGFFWRPGTKIFFLSMYSFFWLNQTVYHAVSIALHLIVAVLFFWLAGKIFKDSLLAFLASLLFLISTGYSEEIFWISSVGHLFNAVFIILALLLFIKWEETKRKIFLISSIVSIALSLLFYELGVVAPLLIIMYRFVIEGASLNLKKNIKFIFTPKIFLFLGNIFNIIEII